MQGMLVDDMEAGGVNEEDFFLIRALIGTERR
jgi:hypothetical protein